MTYLVTGASRGLGLGLVERILEVDGTHAVAAARSPESSQALQDLLQNYKARLTLIKCDTTDESSVEVRHNFRSLSGAGLSSTLVGPAGTPIWLSDVPGGCLTGCRPRIGRRITGRDRLLNQQCWH